ncbi:complement C4-like [Pseudophryne corroboree]|uniref:complement C4-like n=1 Tax=Pseudophryne corroboree TaxID=495146 RepID=UPI003081B987
MAISPLLRCLLWMSVYAAASAQTPSFLITAPRLLHLGLGEDVWVQMEWPDTTVAPNEVKAEMFLRNQNNDKECSKRHTATLSKGNGYIIKQTIELSPKMASACMLDKRRTQQYVQLVVSSLVFGSQQKVVSIPVSYKRGYIFIQTDKSIYTPKEAVNIRVFTLDHMMRPTGDQIICTVSNPEGLQVMKIQRVPENAVVNYRLPIPDISTAGVWTISAYFLTAPESNFTSEFEVRKYVLPNFEVKIVPEHPYFLINNKEFRVKVEARYVYGEPIDGVAYIRLGIINQKGEKTILQGLEQHVKLVDGEGTVQIHKDGIVKKINQPEENLLESTLYIAVSVMEKASGTLEETELTSVKFVTSPYKLDLSKTKKYFIPGFAALIVAEVTYTGGSPAIGVKVKFSKSKVDLDSLQTDEDGLVTYAINTEAQTKSLDVTITAGGAEGRQEETINLIPYTSKTNSFLHLEIVSKVLSPGENLKVTMKVHTPNPESVKKVYYMVLSKGQTLDLKSISRSDLMVTTIPVTAKMVPSFRIIAYYYLNSEIVANSVWADVTDVCEGKLLITTDVAGRIEPGKSFHLTLETDDSMSVALSAVDTAVYLLNSKNKLTPSKVFKAMNAYDLGCSAGGGKDYKSVFTDAGLAFVSSAGYSDFNELGCKISQRKKRSIDFLSLAKNKVNLFSSPNQKKCCMQGMTLLPPLMERDCEKRAKRIPNDQCRKPFLDCCKYAEDLRKKIEAEKRRKHTIGRTQKNEEDDDFVDDSDVQSRSSFPESWLWKTVSVTKKLSTVVYVPDSITTWEIQGIGVSQGKGFCVANPVRVSVFKDFHIHLRLPYSVKRFEQVELRPVLYNYYDRDLEVKLFMEKTEDICSPITADNNPVEQTVTVAAKSALSVPFAIVPIGRSNPIVTLKALGPFAVTDAVKKTLRIEREGVAVVKEKTHFFNLKEKSWSEFAVDDDLPSNMIPDGDFRTSVKMTVDNPFSTINNSLTADGVSRLIRVPYGCAEQTMISTAPGVYALRYLDHTEKWTLLPPDRKDQAKENMRNGYLRILQYRKPEGSYGAWIYRPSSTWLTAFVVKVMSLCRTYIDVNVEEIRNSANYLTNQQNSSGAFQESTPVIHQDMMGGMSGKNAEVSLTAYVLVALHHAKDALSEDDTKVKSSISKAIDYLRTMQNSISDTYTLTVTAYALTLTSSDSILKDNVYTKLMSAVQVEPGKNEMYVGPKGTALAIETTAYALLTTLLRNDMTSAHKLYAWLSEQQNYGGGFKSTQDTVMALEALSEYWIHTFNNEKNEMFVEVNSLEKSGKQTFTLRSEESVQEELKSMGTKFKVKVSGKGTGTVTVLKMYNIMQAETSTCSQLGLEVKVHGDNTNTAETDYSYDYDYEEGEKSDEPRDNMYWHDQRTRVRREISQPKAKDVRVVYEVCLWKKQPGASGMAIVDVTLLSGFEASTQDLNKLKDGLEMYISHYEIQAGRLLLYFDKVSNDRNCVTFEAIQTVKISPLQPASAVLYDFYEPENQCRVFYGAPSTAAFITTLCSGDVCQCAEGPCPMAKHTLKLQDPNRQEFACYSPRVTYGLRVNVVEVTQEGSFTVYKAVIVEVLQKNADENIAEDDIRYFYQRAACRMRLVTKEYLIMGQDGHTKDEKGRMRYFLESNSWIEELASSDVCKATRHRNKCTAVNEFMDNYRNNGCMV